MRLLDHGGRRGEVLDLGLPFLHFGRAARLGRVERAGTDERDARFGRPAHVRIDRVAERGTLPDEPAVLAREIDEVPVEARVEARGEPSRHVGGEHRAGEEDGVEALLLDERRESVDPRLRERASSFGSSKT